MLLFTVPIEKRAPKNVFDLPDVDQWIRDWGDGLLRLCLLYLKDYALAEDALQETFVRAYRAWDYFEHRSSIKTWLTTIAVNVCRSMLRTAWHRRTVSLDEFREESGQENMPDDTVTRAVTGLPTALREVVLMHVYQGMKLREIAEARKLPLSTVASRLDRAKKRLREELKEWYFDEE